MKNGRRLFSSFIYGSPNHFHKEFMSLLIPTIHMLKAYQRQKLFACVCAHVYFLTQVFSNIKTKLQGKEKLGYRECCALWSPVAPCPPGTTIQCLSSPRPQPQFHQLTCLQSWAYDTSCSKSEQQPAGLSSELGRLSRSDLLSAIGRLPSILIIFVK